MPEGHSVHRIARQFAANYLGTAPEVTSPQGRFAGGAAILSGREMTDARAVGKQMFLEFGPREDEEPSWLRVHLGIYGAWDFAGRVRVDPDIEIHATKRGTGRLGQTGMAGYVDAVDEAAEDSVASIGAPRRARVAHVRMAENDRAEAENGDFPPDPVGQVRVRILNDAVCADLRGPTACEVLTPAEVDAVVQKLGPDPANANTPDERDRFVTRARKKRTPIGLVLMEQSVVAGIGNVYRAEMLFRAGLDPHTPANTVPLEVLNALWDDWAKLLDDGIRVGQMITIDGLEGEAYRKALASREDRHWVYKLEGTPCKRCGTNIVLEEFGGRKLYWCPGCQH